jgi:hypothetical protein
MISSATLTGMQHCLDHIQIHLQRSTLPAHQEKKSQKNTRKAQKEIEPLKTYNG